jgi:cytochrome d ubiquinol oxidase subunit II
MPELTTLWFWIIAVMVTLWAVLDGFDFGVGVLHRLVGRSDTERRQVLASIGPVWDGNEVWLLASGGAIFLAFPRLLAAAFSGFYLPVIFVVWALILRGISIELRSHLPGALWRSFFDTTFTVASVAVPVLVGAALGNVIRGVPLNADGFFELPLFASGDALGVLDGYTVLCAALVLVTLTAHGANWLVWKTDGPVRERALALRMPLWLAAFALWLMAGAATSVVSPDVFAAAKNAPMAWIGLSLVFGGAATVGWERRDERAPFFGGVAFIAGSLVTTVACLFPVVLRASGGPQFSLTVTNAASGAIAMQSGLMWWGPGMLLAAAYLWWVLRHFRGKVGALRDGEGD